MEDVVRTLLESEEPSIRLRAHTEGFHESAESAVNRRLQTQVKESARVKQILSERRNGIIPFHPYAKWYRDTWARFSISVSSSWLRSFLSRLSHVSLNNLAAIFDGIFLSF